MLARLLGSKRIKRRRSWAAEYCSGCSACQFPLSYSSLFSITDAAALAGFVLDFRGGFAMSNATLAAPSRVQLFASGVGGYLAGRRARAGSASTLMRSISATLPTALSSGVLAQSSPRGCWRPATASVVSGAAHAGGSALEAAGTAAAKPAAQVAGQSASSEGSSAAYFTDMLFRTDHPDYVGRSCRGAGRGRTYSRH